MRRKRIWLTGSLTVEMSLLMPLILLLLMSSILAVFYFHDKNILAVRILHIQRIQHTYRFKSIGHRETGTLDDCRNMTVTENQHATDFIVMFFKCPASRNDMQRHFAPCQKQQK